MAVPATTTLTPAQATDAAFRAWGSAISAKFDDAGLAKTADTGQIDWATVTTPGAGNTAQGYEIRAFADALQASAPVVFKIEYGSGVAAGTPSLWITFGSGSNGAGALTGVISTRKQVAANGSYATNPLTCYFAGGSSWFAMACFVGGTGASVNYPIVLMFERTKDTNGVNTSEGVLCLVASAGQAAQMFWDCATGQPGAWETTLGSFGMASAPFSTGSQIPVFPIFFNKGVFLNPAITMMAYINAYLTAGSAVAFSMYGASHTYMPIGVNVPPAIARCTQAGSLLMRYE